MTINSRTVRSTHPSRVRRSIAKPSPLRRSTSLPLTALPRIKPRSQEQQQRQRSSLQRTSSAGSLDDENVSHSYTTIRNKATQPTSNPGNKALISSTISPQLDGVMEAISYAQSTMFTEVADRGMGMGSSRVSHLLQFRRNLPPLTSLAHVHALLGRRDGNAPDVYGVSTGVERELSALTASGRLRTIKVVEGRTKDRRGLSELLVLTGDLERAVRADSSIDSSIADKFLALLRQNPRSSTLPIFSTNKHHHAEHEQYALTTSEIATLRNAGFLISSGLLASPSSSSSSSCFTSMDSGATTDGPQNSPASRMAPGSSSRSALTVSLPNIGSYLNLITTARTYLIHLLTSTTTSGLLPLSLLKERWDGSQVDPSTPQQTPPTPSLCPPFIADTSASAPKISPLTTPTPPPAPLTLTTENTGTKPSPPPGKLKKWKHFHGLAFEWVLLECIGAGMVELFETGSVGIGVRVV